MTSLSFELKFLTNNLIESFGTNYSEGLIQIED